MISPILTSVIRALVCISIAVACVPTLIAEEPIDSVAKAGEELERKLQLHIDQLNHDSYRTRQNAKRDLIRIGRDPFKVNALNRALQCAAQHERLQVRDAAMRIQNELADMKFRSQLDRLLTPDTISNEIELPGWKTYSKLAGTSVAARRLFNKMIHHQEGRLRLLDQLNKERANERHSQKVVDSLARYLDPYKIDPDDTSRWVLLFCYESLRLKSYLPNLSNRLSISLCQRGVGPRVNDDPEFLILQKMIGKWIQRRSNIHSNRDRLMIAMRYRCYSKVYDVCDQVFRDPIASPSETTLALLCAAAMQKDDLNHQVLMHIDDERIAHVWQLVTSRKRKIRTQVRDVAMALLLRSRRIDPREVGFTELQADPLFIYREHSLGFPSDESRRRAYQAAAKAMQ